VDSIDVAFVPEATGDHVAVLNSLNLEPPLNEVAAGLGFAVLPHRVDAASSSSDTICGG
jgi:hypothetical protein